MQMGISVLHLISGDHLLIQQKAEGVTLSFSLMVLLTDTGCEQNLNLSLPLVC